MNYKSKKSKTCKHFCEKVHLPEREKIEIEFAKKKKMKYVPIEQLRKTGKKKDKELASLLKKIYINSCNTIFCQKKCKGKQWLNTYSKKRKDRLIEQGAISGCRDLKKEFPEYYRNTNNNKY